MYGLEVRLSYADMVSKSTSITGLSEHEARTVYGYLCEYAKKFRNVVEPPAWHVYILLLRDNEIIGEFEVGSWKDFQEANTVYHELIYYQAPEVLEKELPFEEPIMPFLHRLEGWLKYYFAENIEIHPEDVSTVKIYANVAKRHAIVLIPRDVYERYKEEFQAFPHWYKIPRWRRYRTEEKPRRLGKFGLL